MQRINSSAFKAFLSVLVASAIGTLLFPPKLADASEGECSDQVRDLRVRGELERARDLLDRCLPEQPGNLELEMERIRVLAARGENAEALERVRPLLDRHSEHAGLRLLHIRLLKRQGKVGAALSTIDGYPSNLEKPTPLFKIAGTLRVWNGEYERAIDDLDVYLNRAGEDPEALYYRGIAHQHLGATRAARRDYRSSCEIAPKKTKACAAVHELESGGTTELFGYVRPGYNLVADDLDGWSLDTAIGARLSRGFYAQGGADWRVRSFDGERLSDVLATFEAGQAFTDGLRLSAGGAVGLDPEFTPLWNAFVETGYLFDGGIEPAFRIWRIQFPESGASVLIPKALLYANPFLIDGQFYVTVEDDAETSVAGLLRSSYYFAYPSSISLGIGGGNRSDFIELRRDAPESHLIFLGGISWGISESSTLGFDVIHRREGSGERRYVETQFLVKYEHRIPLPANR